MPTKGQKAALKLVVNQNATKCVLLADETATTSGEQHVALPPKVSKAKEIPTKGQKAAPKLVVNQNATKYALLADETATKSGEQHVASPQKYLKPKKYSQRAKISTKTGCWKRVIHQKASALCDEGAMASDSDLDGEDY